MNQYHNDYRDYFGSSLFDFEIICDNMLNAKEAYAYINNENAFNSVRDRKMYDNFVKIYSHLPEGKYYGQFGINHVFQAAQNNTDWLASLMDKSPSPVENKILSIAYVYEDSEAMLPSNGGYAVQICSNYMIFDGLLEPYIKSDLTLFRLTGKGSPFAKNMKWYQQESMPVSGVTTDYYQFILFIKGSKPDTPLDK